MKNMDHKEAITITHLTEGFWPNYQQLVRNTAIPYQWEALNDRVQNAEPSHAVANLKIAARLAQGEYHGMVFQDSDLAKWLEAVAYSLSTCPNDQLERDADSIIDLLEKAQQDDGYLNSYFTCKEPEKRFTNLYECHELYCAGHMMEAAVAYSEATGKQKFLEIMCRYADHIDHVFGTGDGQIKGYDGHPEIELALIKLYRATKNHKYLKLATFFVDERGQQPNFFDAEWEKRGKTSFWEGSTASPPSENAVFNQTHAPVREQRDAVGHAVRAVYLYAAMADIARETGDEALKDACERLWKSMVTRRMYITGGIGSMHEFESFSLDYDLPNDTAYAESCASIGLIFFAQRMLETNLKGQYADVMERALYNTVLAGMSQDGRSFFYVNPLEVWPEASEKNLGRKHVLARRPPWFSCSCCPPNIVRLISSLEKYIYTLRDNIIGVNLYIGSELETVMSGGKVHIIQQMNHPLDERVRITVIDAPACAFTIALRIPTWSDGVRLTCNGVAINLATVMVDGYAHIAGAWKTGDILELELPKKPMRMRANPLVRSDIGKVALQYGPFVYCLEECDNGNNLHQLVLPENAELVLTLEDNPVVSTPMITATGYRQNNARWGESLYRPGTVNLQSPVTLKFIPYYLWANREIGEMTVWVRE